MFVVHLGSSSEFVKMQFHRRFFSEKSGCVEVEIAVPGFRAQIAPWLEMDDIERLSRELAFMYKSLQGTAALEPVEQQFTLRLETSLTGLVNISGVAWSEATCGSRLDFKFELDQSFLPSVIEQLAEVLNRQ
jgi:hypothetical protein